MNPHRLMISLHSSRIQSHNPPDPMISNSSLSQPTRRHNLHRLRSLLNRMLVQHMAMHHNNMAVSPTPNPMFPGRAHPIQPLSLLNIRMCHHSGHRNILRQAVPQLARHR